MRQSVIFWDGSRIAFNGPTRSQSWNMDAGSRSRRRRFEIERPQPSGVIYCVVHSGCS